jgi:hypothetical protein
MRWRRSTALAVRPRRAAGVRLAAGVARAIRRVRERAARVHAEPVRVLLDAEP